MYEKFYGLKEKPFNVTSDPAFFYLSRRHKEAFYSLIFGIKERKGLLEITGEIGTGKTTLCRALLNQLNAHTKTAFILSPNLSELQLLEAIVRDFGLSPKRRDKFSFLQELNKFLLQEASLGHNVVLIIDEAQNLTLKQLEQVRLLTNLETQKEKLLQIILSGQPELHERLKITQLRQLNQRISVRYHILPLEKDEIGSYIEHRLKVAGSNGEVKFEREAIEEISNYSGGIPRVINILCDRALLAGYVLEKKELGNEIIKRCLEELKDII